jgi:hypothetical protein
MDLSLNQKVKESANEKYNSRINRTGSHYPDVTGSNSGTTR